MANVKRVIIEGEVPFDIYEKVEAQGIWAYFSSPVSGLRIRYGGQYLVPNKTLDPNTPHPGGSTAFFHFALEGCDSVSWSWIKSFKEVVTLHRGKITKDQVTEL